MARQIPIPRKAIVGYKEDDKKWYITIDGKRHPSDFVSPADIRRWTGTMMAAGLYTGRNLYLPNEKTGAYQIVEPDYD